MYIVKHLGMHNVHYTVLKLWRIEGGEFICDDNLANYDVNY